MTEAAPAQAAKKARWARARRWGWLALKVAFSVATLAIVFSVISPARLGALLASVRWPPLLLAVTVFSAVQIAASFRTTQVAAALGGALSFRRSWELNYVSLWMSQVLPSSFGGDVVKGAYLFGDLGARRAAHVVLLDRLSGIAAMLAAIALFLPAYRAYFPDAAWVQFAAFILGSIAIAIIGAFTLSRVDRAKAPALVRPLIDFASDGMRLLHWPFVLHIGWTALLVHVNGVVTYCLLGQALGVDAPFYVFWLLTPLIYIAALFPLAMAGWGVREASAVFLFGLAGVQREQALGLAILYGLFVILTALPGAALLGAVKALDRTASH